MGHNATEDQFNRDISKHVMRVDLDRGVHRCLYFGRPDTSVMHFRLTTWPGCLAISGDMGSFVFSRLHDMFQFFRGGVNPGYWAEKLVAVDRYDGHEKYSADEFRKELHWWFSKAEISNRPGCWSAIEDAVLSHADDSESAAYAAAMSFEWEGNHLFQDFGGSDCLRYTHRYLWCIHAIAWGIEQYDEASTATEEKKQ